MALVNPQIAMSYRPTTEYQPRNALAEYAQIQQIMGGQRQAEVADMQLQRMRQEDAEIERIHQIAMRQGGPDNRMEMGRALFASRNPQQRELGYKILQHEEAKAGFANAEQLFGYAPSKATAATAAPAATQLEEPAFGPEAAQGSFSDRFPGVSMGGGMLSSTPLPATDTAGTPVRMGMAAPRTAPAAADAPAPVGETDKAYLQRQFGMPGVAAPTPAAPAPINALAPAAAPSTNAMLAPAAQPAMPPAGVQLASAGTAPGGAALTGLGGKTLAQLQKEFRTYSMLDQQGAPGAKGRLEEIKREIDFIYKTNEPGAEQNMMRALGLPITEAGFTKFQRLKDNPSELTKLLDKLDLPPAQRRDFELRMAQKLVTHAPSAQQNVYAYTPASEKAQSEFMAESRATFNALKNAQPTLDNIEKAKSLIPGAQGFMGPGGEPLLAAASFLNNRIGTSIDTKGVTDAQELRSRLFFGILDNLKKLDSQPTRAQQDALQQALGSIGTDPAALPRVLDAFGESIRTKVNLYNQDVTDAETRGVRFPYRPQIQLTPPKGAPGAAAQQIPGAAPATAIPQAAINDLKAGRGTDAQFDDIFGAGAAKRVRGGK